MDNHQLSIPQWGDRNWCVLPKELMEIKKRVEKAGTPLQHTKWKININIGVITGLNDAFIVDTKTKDALIEKDPKSEDIIYPMLRGKDIESYASQFQEQWLIFTRRGIDLNQYAAIKEHLLQFKDRLTPKTNRTDKIGRKPGSYKWYEISDAVDYWEDFEKPKIIYPNMTKFMPFAYDKGEHFFTNQKCFILTGDHLEYLTVVFNSSLFKAFFKDEFPELFGNTYELSKVFFETLPVKKPLKKTEPAFVRLCEYMVAVQKCRLQATEDGALWDAWYQKWEALADALVWEHYFPDEVKAAESAIFTELMDRLPQDAPEKLDAAALVDISKELFDVERVLVRALLRRDGIHEVESAREFLQLPSYSTIFKS